MDLVELQSQVKKDPELYRETVEGLIEQFTVAYDGFIEEPSGQHEEFGKLITFLSQVSAFFVVELQTFPSKLIGILENYGQSIGKDFRMTVLQSLILLRNREQIPAVNMLKVCLKIFRIQDKALRSRAFSHLISDIKRINKHTQNHKLNKQMKQLIADMAQDSNLMAAKKSLHLMMTLYKSRVWTDERTVNILAEACLNRQPKLILIGCAFLLAADTEDLYSDSDEEDDPETYVKGGAKKSHKRVENLQKQRKLYEKSQRRKIRKRAQVEPNFLCIDKIRDPQSFVEKLFANMKKYFNKGKFTLRVIMMQLMARLIGRHKLFLIELYSYISRFLTPKNRCIIQLLALLAEGTHELIPPADIQPVVRKIIDSFVSEHCTEEVIVQGLNAIREISRRQPLVMEEGILQDLIGFMRFRNKGVSQAARSLLNLYKELKPSLLPSADRPHKGRDLVFDYGVSVVETRVPGAELLEKPPEELEQEFSNQTVFCSEPEAKSDDLIRLEMRLKEQEQKQLEGSDDSGDSEDSHAESEVPQNITEEIPEENKEPIEQTRIFTQNDFLRIRQLQKSVMRRKAKEELNQIIASSSDDDNPHDFVEEDDIFTKKQTKTDEKEEKKQLRDSFKLKNRKRKGGKTQRLHAKNKPLMMVVGKRKQELKRKLGEVKKDIKRTKQQMGRINKRFKNCSQQLNDVVKWVYNKMALQLYGYWRSSCTWRVRIVLDSAGLEYDYFPVNLLQGEQKADDYKQSHNPMMQVPCLVRNGMSFGQSLAIIRYLLDIFPDQTRHLLPNTPELTAKMWEICEIINSGTQPLQNFSVLVKLEGLGVDKVVWASEAIANGLRAVDQVISQYGGSFSIGDNLTIADACLVPQLFNANRFQVDLNQFPSILRVWETLQKHPIIENSHPNRMPDAVLTQFNNQYQNGQKHQGSSSQYPRYCREGQQHQQKGHLLRIHPLPNLPWIHH